MKRSRPIIVALLSLGALSFATPTADASQAKNLRSQLREETTLLRQSLYSSPDLHVARAELLRTTREWSEVRGRLIAKLELDGDYNDLRQDLLTAQLELREITEWAEGGHPLRTQAAMRILNIKQQIRTVESVAFAGNADLIQARQNMVDARGELKRILDDIRYRLRNDQRLVQLRGRLRAAVRA
ncbi:MAG: hypothetical protein AAGD32_10645 [Planctomycetota bacterium]